MKISHILALLIAILEVHHIRSYIIRPSIRASQIFHSTTVLRDAASNLADLVEVKVIVSGKNVQGPWYRTTVRHETVFNRKCKGSLTEKDDATTEIVIQGPKNRVDSFIRWVKRGPGLSQIVRVDNIEFQTELSAEILASESQFQEKLLTSRR